MSNTKVYVLSCTREVKPELSRVFTTHQLANAAWQRVSNRYDWTLDSVTLEDTKAGATE